MSPVNPTEYASTTYPTPELAAIAAAYEYFMAGGRNSLAEAVTLAVEARAALYSGWPVNAIFENGWLDAWDAEIVDDALLDTVAALGSEEE